MQQYTARDLFIRSSILLWSILCVSVFIFYPGKGSTISGSTMDDWPFLLLKLNRIEVPNYMVGLLWSLIGIVIFSTVCISAGKFLLQFFEQQEKAPSSSRLESLAYFGTAFAIGQGSLSIIFFILAIYNQLTAVHVIFVLLTVFAIGIRPILRSINFVKIKKYLNPFNSLDSRLDRTIIWLNIVAIALSLMYSTSRLSYDSGALYFSSAKITALTDHIQYYSKFFIVSVFQTGIQYSALMQVFGDQAARLYSWLNGVFIIIFAMALGEKAGLTRRANIILFSLILTSTAFLDLLGDGKVELASTVPAIGAIYWLEINKDKRSKAALFLTGILAGLAMTARPNNIFLLAMVIGLIYFQRAYHHRKEDKTWIFDQFLMPLVWMGTGILCLITYHLFANWLLLGDPLAFLRTYETINWSQWQWALNPDQIWKFRLLYPLVVTYLNTPQTLGNITPLFIGFLPGLLLLGLRKKMDMRREIYILVIAVLITLLIWLLAVLTIFEIRYILFLWIILFLPAAVIIEKIIEGRDPFLQNTSKFLVVALLAFILFRIVYISIDSYSPIDREGNPHCYDFVFCDFLKPVNDLAGQGDRVLSLTAYRYYLRTDLFACSSTLGEYTVLENLSHEDNTEFWIEVYREGYKFITYESNYSVWHLLLGMIPNPYNTPPWLTLKPIYGKPGDPEVSYQIQVKDPPVKVGVICNKSISGVWELDQVQK